MINLLPPKEKQILLKEKQFREILILETVILIALSFLGLILFLIKTDLKNKILLQETILTQKEQEFKIAKIDNLEKEIKSFNQTLFKLNSFFQSHFYLTDILKDLANLKPSEIYFTSISFNQKEKELSISGFSPDRTTLTEFKKNLAKKENFKEIYFPPSNWIKPKDIEFFVSFKLEIE